MTCKCDLLDRLTAEQFDISYRTSTMVAKPKLRKTYAPKAKVLTTVEQDTRDTLMFNAGRWAAGARDSVAVAANNVFQEMMGFDV